MQHGFRWDAGGAGGARRRDMKVRLHRRRSCGSSCNLGYAEGCARLPREREWDSVRFAARTLGDAQNRTEARILVRYVCEREHRPAGSGTLEFDAFESRWVERHRDDRVQRMAECFLESFLEKKKKQEVARAAAS